MALEPLCRIFDKRDDRGKDGLLERWKEINKFFKNLYDERNSDLSYQISPNKNIEVLIISPLFNYTSLLGKQKKVWYLRKCSGYDLIVHGRDIF